MKRLETADDLAHGLQRLLARDRRLKQVADVAGDVPLRRRPAGFAGLARIVVGQQVSVASASAIWSRFAAALPAMDAPAIAAADDATLKRVGLSAPKIGALRAVAAACANGLDLDRLADAPADEARAALVAVKGVGPWTADIYLMFCLGHADLFPAGDLALRQAVASAFGLEGAPSPDRIAEVAAAWSPWRTVAAHLFWAYYGATKARKAIPI